MSRVFCVKGVNPGTGRIVELLLVAATATDAKRNAQESGLRHVVVSEGSEYQPDQGVERGGSRPSTPPETGKRSGA